MAIVSGSTDLKSLPSMNGNSDHSLLQLDDEESFVVLERSTASDEEIAIDGNVNGYQPLPVSYSFPVFNNLVSSGMVSSQSPLINQPVPEIEPLGLQFESAHSTVSVEEIEKRLQDVIHENINLKEIVYQTNMAMKQQLKTVSLVQDRALETQRNHQEKFEETKSLILKLGSEKNILQETNGLIASQLEKLKEENKVLKSANEAFGNEISKCKEDTKQLKESNMALVTETTKLLSENETLKKHLTAAQEAVQTASESSKVSASELVAENESLKNRLASAEALQCCSENSKIAELMEETQNLKKQLESAKEAYQNACESGKIAAAELVAENKSLKNQLASAEAFQHASESSKKSSQQSAKEIELHQLVGDLTRKLEIVERARRDQEFGLDRLQAQLGRVTEELTDTQRKLAHSENGLQASQSLLQTENSFQYGEKLNKYLGLLKQLKDSLDEEQSRCNSLGSWLNLTPESGNVVEFEISELRRLLQEEQEHSVKMKTCLYSGVTMIHEILADFKSLGEELEKVRADHAVKESHSLAYDEMQKKGFRERLDSLTAKLVEKEEALAISQRHLDSLQEAVRLQNAEKEGSGEVKVLKDQVKNLTDEVQAKKGELQATVQQMETLRTELAQKLQAASDTVMVLEEQAKIYQADFEAERKSRELVVAEKERVIEDFRHLVKRNEALLKQINELQNNPPHENTVPSQVTSQSSSSLRRQEQTPSPPTPRNKENLTILKQLIFHEKQYGRLCAQHCLNALLQRAHFNAVDLAEIAREMDFEEKTKLEPSGNEVLRSKNMDDTGYFSVQVINCALQLWGLDLVPYRSSNPRLNAARKNPADIKAFICNSCFHWFTIRRLGGQWFNLDSTFDEPKQISDFYLDIFLQQLEMEGHSIFVVLGDFPICLADEAVNNSKNVTPTFLKT